MIKIVLHEGELYEEWKGHRVPVHWEKVWDYLYNRSWTDADEWEIDQNIKDHIEILGNLLGKEKPSPSWVLASGASTNWKAACTASSAQLTIKQFGSVSAYSTFPGLKKGGK